MKFGEKNVGNVDKAARAVVGIAALYAAVSGMLPPPLNAIAAALAIAMFATAAFGTCAIYSLIGFNSAK